jgi:hypothetical protein
MALGIGHSIIGGRDGNNSRNSMLTLNGRLRWV